MGWFKIEHDPPGIMRIDCQAIPCIDLSQRKTKSDLATILNVQTIDVVNKLYRTYLPNLMLKYGAGKVARLSANSNLTISTNVKAILTRQQAQHFANNHSMQHIKDWLNGLLPTW